MNQTMRAKTKDELLNALYALTPLAFFYPTLELPKSGNVIVYAFFLLSSAGFAAYSVQKRLRRRTVSAVAEGSEPDVKITRWMLMEIWGFVAFCTALIGYAFGWDISVAVANASAPSWHRLWTVLVANYFGWATFWVWRTMFDLTAELHRSAPVITNAPIIVMPKIVPASASQGVPAAPPVALKNEITRP